jgi:hypothetical protein
MPSSVVYVSRCRGSISNYVGDRLCVWWGAGASPQLLRCRVLHLAPGCAEVPTRVLDGSLSSPLRAAVHAGEATCTRCSCLLQLEQPLPVSRPLTSDFKALVVHDVSIVPLGLWVSLWHRVRLCVRLTTTCGLAVAGWLSGNPS